MNTTTKLIENPLNTEWSVFSYRSGDEKTAYTEAEICYGTNKYGDGPKGRVCKVYIDGDLPVEVRKAIMNLIAKANDGV